MYDVHPQWYSRLVSKPDGPLLVLIRLAGHACLATRKHQWILDDRSWELIAPFVLPQSLSRGFGGRPRIDHRAALGGILFVLHTLVPPGRVRYGAARGQWRLGSRGTQLGHGWGRKTPGVVLGPVAGLLERQIRVGLPAPPGVGPGITQDVLVIRPVTCRRGAR
jgi:hypothetical protein